MFDVGTPSLLPDGPGGTVWLEYYFMNQYINWHHTKPATGDANPDKQIKTHFLTAAFQHVFNPLRTPHEVGKAIRREDEDRLLTAISRSRSPALLPLFVRSIDTGLRANEIRQLRHRDLTLVWRNGAVEQGWLIVSRSKTEGGTGRTIPLTRRACAALTLWLSRFPQAGPEAFVFPSYRIAGNGRGSLYGVDLNRAIGSWKRAWRDALSSTALHYRWHDLRHTLVSQLAENPAVSEQTIMALAGHVSKSMLARYSHIRTGAKQAAIDALEADRIGAKVADFSTGSPQSEAETSADHFTAPENALN